MTAGGDLQLEALEAAISPDRLGTYLSEADGDRSLAREFYVWDRDVASAMFADIAIIEVALRNAIHGVLTAHLGERWYELGGIPLDWRATTNLQKAWERLPAQDRANPDLPHVPGKLVARLMFGFWRDLFDSGGYVGKEPRRVKVDYEQNWRAVLHRAFPGGRRTAQSAGEAYSRDWVLRQIDIVHAARNRVAHHEPLLRGFPLPGQGAARLTVEDGYLACVRLANMIDFNLADWLRNNSNVPNLLAKRPTQ
ncbi:hypothetical protein FB468_3241 [Leucobacter komagatae]|uniref:Abi-like protein n=1 Tax=Leucobacter komagatae TaxID=55969 RepID=A0A542XY32_9MICO|nr:Abi family protein [Leucobacter komagatae]TQL40718.1 hypothetical protein FB468_3241 [Leucobacter komagatae]